MRTLRYGAALALTVGFAAFAQTSASQPVTPPAASTPPATDANATSAAALKAGMVVKDSTGITVGQIAKAGAAPDGTVALSIDGKTVHVAASALSLSPSGKEVVSSKSKAELKAAPGSPG
jgi:hypothetical protein